MRTTLSWLWFLVVPSIGQASVGFHEQGQKKQDSAATRKLQSSITIDSDDFFPESVAVHGDTMYLSAFFTGEIQEVDLSTGSSKTLVEAGLDGVVAGWGLWYDEAGDVLLACANRNALGEQTNNNAAREINPATGEILAVYELPSGAMCNTILEDGDGSIYMSDVGPQANLIKINRTTGEVITWLDEPAFENGSGFGVGGIAFEGGSIYTSVGGLLYRVPIDSDGSAGTATLQQFVDDAGAATDSFSFDGFVGTGDGIMYGAAISATGSGMLVKVQVIDSLTVKGSVIFESHGITGVDYEDGVIFAADGQIAPFLIAGSLPVLPFKVYKVVAGEPSLPPSLLPSGAPVSPPTTQQPTSGSNTLHGTETVLVIVAATIALYCV